MKKTYADQCLKRAKIAQEIADQRFYGLEAGCDAWLELKKLDAEMRNEVVPELARRLKEACEALREACFEGSTKGKDLADELEAPLENNE